MTQITEEWVLFWYQCLSENLTYTRYCSATETGDEKTCGQLEKAFPLLPELFKDFGAPLGWPRGGVDGTDWKDWFTPRRHLFLQEVEQVGADTTEAPLEGYVTLRIPLQSSAEATSALVREHLHRLYASTAPKPASLPKYRLNMRGRRIACGYEQVRQAVHTSTVSYVFDQDYEYVNLRRAISNFVRGELDSLGWQMGVKERAELMKPGGCLDDDAYERFRARVDKCRRDFVALSQNALHGRFPDVTPRGDSDVMDQFWGE